MGDSILKIDLHVHSVNSRDGFETVDDLLAAARKRGLSGIAVTDHDVITLRRSELRNGMFLLQGAEVSTVQGHVLVYNYSGKLYGDAFELVEHAREEGGITVAAHPFGLRGGCLRSNAFKVGADCIERFNGKSFANNLYNLLKGNQGTGGGDAHVKEEVGNAYTVFGDGCEKIEHPKDARAIAEGNSVEDIWECMRKQKFDAKWDTSLASLAIAKWRKTKRILAGRGFKTS